MNKQVANLLFTIFVSFFILINISNAQQLESNQKKESCTSIMVGKKATFDGSVITAHTCDSYYRTWLSYEPAQKNENPTQEAIYKGAMHTKFRGDTTGVKIAGYIPAVAETYKFLNTAYPSVNEKQLAIGETTFSGPDTLRNKNGMFMIEELQRIALQRCTTARQAIATIGEMIEKYGYADGGECLTIADKNEVWQMEILGEGPDKIGGVWAAQRIPDDHVGISANISRISEIDLKNKDFFMASKNVKEVAKKYKLWDGKEPFKFWKAYSGKEKPFMIREFWVLSQLAPSLNLSMNMDELPFSVKPEEKVTLEKLFELYRSTYEGSEYDMTKNLKFVKQTRKKGEETKYDTVISPRANPWIMRNEKNLIDFIAPDAIDFVRTVSVSWCAYSHITQLRSWLPDEVGAVSWFSFDNPAESPRIPIYMGATKLPQKFDKCGYREYNENAAIWDYRKANRLATVAWGLTKDLVLKNILLFEEKANFETPKLEEQAVKLIKDGKTEEATKLLNNYTSDFAASTAQKWKEMEARFWSMFGNGF